MTFTFQTFCRLVDAVRRRVDPFYRRAYQRKVNERKEQNRPYEEGCPPIPQPTVLPALETLHKIQAEHLSVSRYGDGEFRFMVGGEIGFQSQDAALAQRLWEVLRKPLSQHLVCFPKVFGALEEYVPRAQDFWRQTLPLIREHVLPNIPYTQTLFGDTNISRAYIDYLEKAHATKCFDAWKQLFAAQSLLIVEGRYTRLGVGNDLLSTAASVRRIWAPAENAFSVYDTILETVRQYATPQDLILIALGPTATVLAYDLAKAGYWAIDVGHLDVEYLWMQMGAKRKVPLPGRYVNECVFAQEMKALPGEVEQHHVLAVIEKE